MDPHAAIIAMFFNSLQSRHPEIVGAAKNGLGMAIRQHKLPKELLQTCLRPILANLADYRKLSVTYLQGLARLLERVATDSLSTAEDTVTSLQESLTGL